MIRLYQSIVLCLLSLFILLGNVNNVNAALGDYNIVCGTTPKGQDLMCNTQTHRCERCKIRTTPWIMKNIAEHVKYEYRCSNKNTDLERGCSVSNSGGREGASHTRVFGFKVAKDEGNECVTSNFLAMYTSTCYSCEIVETLSSAFIRAAAKTYSLSKQAANAILILGMIIWIAIYILKNISSFTTVEPRQMVQGLLVQFFKIYIAYVVINSGISTILHYTMEPLMLAGTDFGDAIISSAAPIGGL